MTAVVVAVSLAAAVAFGWSTAAMHHSASAAPPGGLVALLRHLLGQPGWLSGMAASLLGLGLHALALRLGSLLVVQPVIVTGLVFSLLFRDALDRRLPSRETLTWSGLTVVGLAVFLIAARSTTGSARPIGAEAILVLAVGTTVAVSCWLAAASRADRGAGLLLGAGAGVNFGLTAGTLKATAGSTTTDALVTSWPLYTLVVLGVSGFFANQVAYRRAPLATSLPILNVLNPVVALLYGVVAFRERPATDAVTWVVALVSLGAALLGVYRLARLETVPAEV